LYKEKEQYEGIKITVLRGVTLDFSIDIRQGNAEIFWSAARFRAGRRVLRYLAGETGDPIFWGESAIRR
jgi:hypothetical protein